MWVKLNFKYYCMTWVFVDLSFGITLKNESIRGWKLPKPNRFLTNQKEKEIQNSIPLPSTIKVSNQYIYIYIYKHKLWIIIIQNTQINTLPSNNYILKNNILSLKWIYFMIKLNITNLKLYQMQLYVNF